MSNYTKEQQTVKTSPMLTKWTGWTKEVVESFGHRLDMIRIGGAGDEFRGVRQRHDYGYAGSYWSQCKREYEDITGSVKGDDMPSVWANIMQEFGKVCIRVTDLYTTNVDTGQKCHWKNRGDRSVRDMVLHSVDGVEVKDLDMCEIVGAADDMIHDNCYFGSKEVKPQVHCGVDKYRRDKRNNKDKS